jgi:hypothetical protein
MKHPDFDGDNGYNKTIGVFFIMDKSENATAHNVFWTFAAVTHEWVGGGILLHDWTLIDKMP